MDDERSVKEQVALRQGCKDLLATKAFPMLLDTITQTCFIEFCATAPDEVQKREQIHAQMLGVQSIRTLAENWAELSIPEVDEKDE